MEESDNLNINPVFFLHKGDQFENKTPPSPDHNLLQLGHALNIGHKKACIKDTTGI